jgi:hypothetical protein
MLGARPEPLNLSLPPQLALALAHKRPSRASGFVLGREAALCAAHSRCSLSALNGSSYSPEGRLPSTPLSRAGRDYRPGLR